MHARYRSNQLFLQYYIFKRKAIISLYDNLRELNPVILQIGSSKKLGYIFSDTST